MKNDDAIAGSVLRDALTDGGYDASGLVSVDPGSREQVVLNFLKICMTNPTALYANQHLAGADIRNGHVIDADNFARAMGALEAMQTSGFHRTVHGQEWSNGAMEYGSNELRWFLHHFKTPPLQYSTRFL